jgi:hypothetical protein
LAKALRALGCHALRRSRSGQRDPCVVVSSLMHACALPSAASGARARPSGAQLCSTARPHVCLRRRVRLPHLRGDWGTHPHTSAPGLGSPLPHCAGTGLAHHGRALTAVWEAWHVAREYVRRQSIVQDAADGLRTARGRAGAHRSRGIHAASTRRPERPRKGTVSALPLMIGRLPTGPTDAARSQHVATQHSTLQHSAAHRPGARGLSSKRQRTQRPTTANPHCNIQCSTPCCTPAHQVATQHECCNIRRQPVTRSNIVYRRERKHGLAALASRCASTPTSAALRRKL